VNAANIVLNIPIVATVVSIDPNTQIFAKVTTAVVAASQTANIYVVGYYAT
jgi:hypothetical protein